jgi:hypothetical protein
VGSAGAAPHLSADTAPAGLAVRRPVWVAPAFLLTLGVVCALVLPRMESLTAWYGAGLALLTGRPVSDVLVPGASVSFRPLVAVLLACLALFAVGPATGRLGLLAFSWALYGAVVGALDALVVRLGPSFWPSPLGTVGGVTAASAGVLVVVVTTFTHRRLPAGVNVPTRRLPSRANFVILPVCAGIALSVVGAMDYARSRLSGRWTLRLTGWTGSEVVLFVTTTACLLLVVSRLERRSKPSRGPSMSVAFLVPAYNEAHAIDECIRGLEAAAARYRGPSAAYVVDNASSDGTGEVAARALGRCRHLRGQVLECPTPGKSNALNLGLSRISEDVVVRVDADTTVAPSVLEAAVPWFWDRGVGGVGGFPLPKRLGPSWLRSLQLIEYCYTIAFCRVAASALDGITVMPGSIAAYRRRLLNELGGFGRGFNGEDSDITMRIGRLGYRIVTDARVRVSTEAPRTLGQLREQRQRWSRGRFHMAGRNLSSISMRQGIRGLWMLPYSVFSASRRCLTIPLLVCAVMVSLGGPAPWSWGGILSLARLAVGIQLSTSGVLLVAQREFSALPFVPFMAGYRLLLAYISLEAMLTLPLRARSRPRWRLRRLHPRSGGRLRGWH